MERRKVMTIAAVLISVMVAAGACGKMMGDAPAPAEKAGVSSGDRKAPADSTEKAEAGTADTEKNEKGVTVVTRSGLIKLEEIYKKTIFEDEPVSEDVKQRELMEILVDEKNAEIVRLYEQLKAKDSQLAKKDEQLRIKDVQIAEKDKQLDQQQQLTAKAMNERETLLLELDEAKEKVQEQESKGFWARLFGK